MKKFITVALLLTSFASPLCAEEKPCGIMDIKNAVNITLGKNAELRSLREELLKADAFGLMADGTWLPSVSAEGQANKQKEPVFLTNGTSGKNKQESHSAMVSLKQTLYSGGKDSAVRRQASQKKKIADYIVAQGENKAIGEVFARFYLVILNKERIAAEESAVKTSELHLKEVKRMSELGLANKLDVIRAAQQMASNTADLTEAKGKYETSLNQLKNYMALPPDTSFEIAGELFVPAPKGSREESLATARALRPDLGQLSEEVKFLINQLEIENSAIRPKVYFNLSGGQTNPYKRLDETGDTWKGSITVDVPIFDKNVTRSNVLTAKADLNMGKISKEQKEVDILSEVDTAWTEIEISQSHLKASKKSLDLATEALRLAQVGYEEGVTPQIDLLEAQTTLTNAQLDYISSKYSSLITIVSLKMTEGNIKEWVKESDFNEYKK